MPPSRAAALRPTLLVLAGLVVLAAVAGLALRDRSNVQAPPAAVPPQAESPQAMAQPEAPATAPPAEKPTFDIVRINPQGNAVMAGHAAPGSEVTIAAGGKEVGHTQADQRGDWVFVPTAPLAPGARELTLAERTPGGGERKATARSFLSCRRPPPRQVLRPLRIKRRRWPCLPGPGRSTRADRSRPATRHGAGGTCTGAQRGGVRRTRRRPHVRHCPGGRHGAALCRQQADRAGRRRPGRSVDDRRENTVGPGTHSCAWIRSLRTAPWSPGWNAPSRASN